MKSMEERLNEANGVRMKNKPMEKILKSSRWRKDEKEIDGGIIKKSDRGRIKKNRWRKDEKIKTEGGLNRSRWKKD